ncbi:MAG: phytoene/squalene synthase family protein [Euryarchaeota archaeon]|tara:strand:+ start:247 stop:1266 length:1020 start_codon:yes stop_codon:yes gene_type:complete
MAEIVDEHIDGLLKATSRSFHLTLTSLPNSVRDQVGLLYLLARLADTIADSKTKDVDSLIEALDGYQNLLVNDEKLDLSNIALLQEDADEKRLLENLESVVKAYRKMEENDSRLMQRCLDVIISGQRLDLVRFGALGSELTCLDNDTELDDYAYRVAGSVGEFWTAITLQNELSGDIHDTDTFDSLGIRFGKALQMTNILRDIPADLALGRCYIPSDRLSEISLNHRDLGNPASIETFRPLYDSYLDLTCDHYDSAIDYIRMIPRKYRSLRMACLLPVVIGLETIALLRNGNVLDASERIKVDRRKIRKIAVSCIISTRSKAIENRVLRKARIRSKIGI